MSLKFRKLTGEEEELLQMELHYWLGKQQAKKFRSKNAFLIAEGNWIEVILTSEEVFRLVEEQKHLKPYSVGLTFGEIKKGRLLLTLGGAGELCSSTNNKVVINAAAEQLFLYRRDILCKAILEYPGHLGKGKKVLVVNEQNDCLGVGTLLCTKESYLQPENAERRAVKNLMDLGWYLRKGR